MPRAGCWPTFWESTGTFRPSGLQRWWGVKGGHRAPSSAGQGGSRVWSFRFEPLFAGAVHRRGGVYWSLHTLVWHLEGQHRQGEPWEGWRRAVPARGKLTVALANLSRFPPTSPSSSLRSSWSQLARSSVGARPSGFKC